MATSVNGDGEHDPRTRSNSVAVLDDEDDKEKQEANEHIANYVTNQLERIRSHESVAVYEDEFEAQLDNH